MSGAEIAGGRWPGERVFIYRQIDVDGTDTDFETDQAITDTPTQTITDIKNPANLRTGVIKRIQYWLNEAGGDTYILTLYKGASADDVESLARILWQSPVLQASGEQYDREVTIPFILANAGVIFYQTNWTGGAPGNTPGLLEVSGIEIE